MGNATATDLAAAGEGKTTPDHQPLRWNASTTSCWRKRRGDGDGDGGRGRTCEAATDSAGAAPPSVGVGDDVAGGGGVATLGIEADHGGLEPGVVEAGVVDADLDLGAGGQWRRQWRRLLGRGRRWGCGGGRGALLLAPGAAELAGERRRAAGGHGELGFLGAVDTGRASRLRR
jgi:hypothetical protein